MNGLRRVPEGILRLVGEVWQDACLVVLVSKLFDQINTIREFVGVPYVKVTFSVIINPDCEGQGCKFIAEVRPLWIQVGTELNIVTPKLSSK